MATHSRILAWRIPWTEGPGGLYSPWGHRPSDTTEREVEYVGPEGAPAQDKEAEGFLGGMGQESWVPDGERGQAGLGAATACCTWALPDLWPDPLLASQQGFT